MSRPLRLTAKLGETLCRRIAEGETVTALCAEADMPTRRRLQSWLAADTAFAAAFRAARREQLETWAEQILALADSLEAEESREALARTKLRIEVRQWLIARLAPRPEEPAADPARPVVLQVVTGIERPGDPPAGEASDASAPEDSLDETPPSL